MQRYPAAFRILGTHGFEGRYIVFFAAAWPDIAIMRGLGILLLFVSQGAGKIATGLGPA